MVQSNGTRAESQRFRIDFTGNRKYSGRSGDFRWLSAGGEHAARRAMPTSGTTAFRVRPSARLAKPRGTASCEAGGGQSAVGQPEMLPIKPALVGASTFIWRSPGELPAFGVGLVALGLTGKSDAVDCVARRRGIPRVRAVEERTGDIAHLEARGEFFAFSSSIMIGGTAVSLATHKRSRPHCPASIHLLFCLFGRNGLRQSPSARFLLGACIVLFSAASGPPIAQQLPPPQEAPPPQPQAAQVKKAPVGPAAPQSTHFPILLLVVGNDQSWSLRIGQKGPERMDRNGYPPIPLETTDVVREGTTDTWTYNAKDSQTGDAVSVHITREPCTDPASTAKLVFTASIEHAQIGSAQGCARV